MGVAGSGSYFFDAFVCFFFLFFDCVSVLASSADFAGALFDVYGTISTGCGLAAALTFLGFEFTSTTGTSIFFSTGLARSMIKGGSLLRF